jgi:hypothetical protein
MAMTTSRGGGGGSYSYTVTYTLEQAVEMASRGSLSPGEVYRQMQGPLQNAVNQIALRQFSSSFSSLTDSQQQSVMGAFSREIKNAKEHREKPMSIVDALELASEGKVDDLKLYGALPEELHKVLEAIASSLNAASFKAANPDVRQQIWKVVSKMLRQQDDSDEAKDTPAKKGLECHNSALDLKSQGSTSGAIATMREAEKLLAKAARETTQTSKASVMVYCNWSSALAYVGDWICDAGVLKAAIEAADRGLAMAEELPQVSRFEQGVLLHNRGHAGWRLGEVTDNRGILMSAIEDLGKAGGVFKSLQNSAAVGENANLLAKANSALALSKAASIAPAAGHIPTHSSTPHAKTDANRAAELNLKYQADLRRWEGLGWRKRRRTPKPEPPKEI